MASLDDVVSYLKSGVQNIGLLNQTLQTYFPQVKTLTIGSFTAAAATSTTISQPLMAANSAVILIPTNAAAGTLMAGANTLYLSARTANTSFRFSTAGGGSAAGTETFLYVLLTV